MTDGGGMKDLISLWLLLCKSFGTSVSLWFLLWLLLFSRLFCEIDPLSILDNWWGGVLELSIGSDLLIGLSFGRLYFCFIFSFDLDSSLLSLKGYFTRMILVVRFLAGDFIPEPAETRRGDPDKLLDRPFDRDIILWCLTYNLRASSSSLCTFRLLLPQRKFSSFDLLLPSGLLGL